MGQNLVIIIPGEIFAPELLERFADPLCEVLARNGLGELVATGEDRCEVRRRIEWCVIEISVRNVQKAMPLIRRCLKAANAPEGTTIREVETGIVHWTAGTPNKEDATP